MNLFHRQIPCLKIWSFLGISLISSVMMARLRECFEDTGCFWTSWPELCTMCWRISACYLGCVYASDNNLKTPLTKTTELAKGKQHPFKGPHCKQHFSSLHSLPTEQGCFLTLLRMLFFKEMQNKQKTCFNSSRCLTEDFFYPAIQILICFLSKTLKLKGKCYFFP